MTRFSPWTLVLLMIVALAAGATTVAAIPGSDGALHACVDERTRQVRLVDEEGDCGAGASQLSWVVQGAQGAQGPPGPQGPAGPDAPAGGDPSRRRAPVHLPRGFKARTRTIKSGALLQQLAALGSGGEPTEAFSTAHDGELTLPAGDDYAVVAKLNVPAGRYSVTAKAMIVDPGSLAHAARCRLQAGADFDDQTPIASPLFSTVVHRFKKPGTIELRCVATSVGWYDYETKGSKELPAAAKLAWIKLTAIRLATLKNTATGPPF